MANLAFLPVQQGSQSTSVVMLLHGIGGNERSITSIASGIDPRLTVISVRAPLTIGPTSFAWCPTTFGPNGPTIDAHDAEQGRQALLKFITDFREERNIQKIYSMGFSQGAIMAVTAALSAPALVQAAIGFSGRFPEEFAGVVRPPTDLKATRIWIGHGTEDSKLPIHLGRSMRDSLKTFSAIAEYSDTLLGMR